MNYRIGILAVLVCGLLATSCEDVITIDLNKVDAQLVIIGEVSNVKNQQMVTITRTVAFDAEVPSEPVSGATVEVVDGNGRVFPYKELKPGSYIAVNFQGRENERYDLRVQVDGNEYTASSTMPRLITADSIGTAVRSLFGEEQKFISIKFRDPEHVANFYRYLWRVNRDDLKMLHVSRDKFNNGKYISEDLMDFDTDLYTGDSVIVQMQCIDRATFDFWNAVQSINPGSAAPANPPSVFGKGALGYFSATAMSEISTVVL